MVIITTNFEDMYKIKFKFNKDKYGNYNCQTLMSYDTETTNGILDHLNGKAIAYDRYKYILDEEYKEFVNTHDKVSTVWMWQFAIEFNLDILVFYGRTLDTYLDFMIKLCAEIQRQAKIGFTAIDRENETLCAQSMKGYVNIYPYIHNEGFDYQSLRNIFDKEFSRKIKGRSHTFARSERRPMKATVTLGKTNITYKDSFVLTQKSLAHWGEDAKLPITKIKVDRDFYLKFRNPYTELTEEEINYSCYDVATMIEGLKIYREKYKTVENIPLTQTGEIRRALIKLCHDKIPWWQEKCYNITRNYTFDFFKFLCDVFQGGWTHANANLSGKVLHHLRCFDFASSYPYVMTTTLLPTGEFEEKPVAMFEDYLSDDVHKVKYRWIAEITFKNVVTKKQNTYWSSSKVCAHKPVKGIIPDNGRIYSAREFTTRMSDFDFDTFRQMYDFEYEVKTLYVATADYLPKEIIEYILQLYTYKTTLKGVEGAESLYNESKQFINSVYGCSVTKILTEIIDYCYGWSKKQPTEEDFYNAIAEIKKDKTFLMYQLGYAITACARHNLFDIIIHCDERIAYCDTDSAKGKFTEDDIKFIDEYNKNVEIRENMVAAHLGINPELFAPKDPKGKTRRLGIFSEEDEAITFITRGAKRYAYLIDNNGHYEMHTTIAGLPKDSGTAVVKHARDLTRNDLVWDVVQSGKNTPFYNDNQPTISWTDYQGHTYIDDSKYGCCILPTTFDLKVTENYDKFVQYCNGDLSYEDAFNDIPDILR